MPDFNFEVSGTIENLELMIEVPEGFPIEYREVSIYTGTEEDPLLQHWQIAELDIRGQNLTIAVLDFSAALKLGYSTITAMIAGEGITHALPKSEEKDADAQKEPGDEAIGEPKKTFAASDEVKRNFSAKIKERLHRWYNRQKERFTRVPKGDGAERPPTGKLPTPEPSSDGGFNWGTLLFALLILAVLGFTAFGYSMQLGIAYILLIALWIRLTIRIIPADRMALREIAGYIHGYVEGGIHSTLIPFLGKFVEYPTENQDISIGQVDVVTAAGFFDPKLEFIPVKTPHGHLVDNGQPTEEQWKEKLKDPDERKEIEQNYRWEKATLTIQANVNFSWPKSLKHLTMSRRVAPQPILPELDQEEREKRYKALQDFFREPIQDAIQDVTSGRVWMQIFRDVNWITGEICYRLRTQINNPITRAGLLETYGEGELEGELKSFRVTITIQLPKDLAEAMPRIQAAKYEADAVRATADGEEYRLIREGYGRATALKAEYEVKDRYPAIVAATAIENTKGTHIGATSYVLNELNRMLGRGYSGQQQRGGQGRPRQERRDDR